MKNAESRSPEQDPETLGQRFQGLLAVFYAGGIDAIDPEEVRALKGEITKAGQSIDSLNYVSGINNPKEGLDEAITLLDLMIDTPE